MASSSAAPGILPPDMMDTVNQARAAGMSDDDIVGSLSKHPVYGSRVQGILNQGASASDIVGAIAPAAPHVQRQHQQGLKPSPNETPGVADSGLGKVLAAPYASIGGGVSRIANAPDASEVVGGASDIARGAAGVLAPAMLPGAVAAPARAALGLGAAAITGAGSELAAKALDVPKGFAEGIGTAVGLGGGKLADGLVGEILSLPRAKQDALMDLIPVFGKKISNLRNVFSPEPQVQTAPIPAVRYNPQAPEPAAPQYKPLPVNFTPRAPAPSSPPPGSWPAGVPRPTFNPPPSAPPETPPAGAWPRGVPRPTFNPPPSAPPETPPAGAWPRGVPRPTFNPPPSAPPETPPAGAWPRGVPRPTFNPPPSAPPETPPAGAWPRGVPRPTFRGPAPEPPAPATQSSATQMGKAIVQAQEPMPVTEAPRSRFTAAGETKSPQLRGQEIKGANIEAKGQRWATAMQDPSVLPALKDILVSKGLLQPGETIPNESLPRLLQLLGGQQQ